MAKQQLKSVVVVVKQDHDNDIKWLKHYSSTHQILSVGDGDFSFSLCLATAFASASNITATSLDSYDEVIRKYKDSKSNIQKLKKFGARVLHRVDATKMMHHPDLKSCKFDKIVFSFPHAGFHGKEEKQHMIRMHRSFLNGFFKNASRMLRSDGEVHVNHKTTKPYCHWNLKQLAASNSLSAAERTEFVLRDYPGYSNKRGDGPRCDEAFRIGHSSTYKFTISRKSRAKAHNNASSKHRVSSSPRHYNYHELKVKQFINDADIQYVESISKVTRPQCAWIYGEHLFELFGRSGRDVEVSLHEDLRQGYEQYMAESTERTVNGYMYLLCEVQRMSVLESAWLRTMLVGIGRRDERMQKV